MPATELGTLRQVRRFDDMNEQAKVCRRKAAECERAAVSAIEPRLQAMYRDLARQWREMAEQSEELERRHSASKEPQRHFQQLSALGKIGSRTDNQATFSFI